MLSDCGRQLLREGTGHWMISKTARSHCARKGPCPALQLMLLPAGEN